MEVCVVRVVKEVKEVRGVMEAKGPREARGSQGPGELKGKPNRFQGTRDQEKARDGPTSLHRRK